MIAIKNNNNTLVHRGCENGFFMYYLFSLSFETPPPPPVINSETKEANQLKRACFIGKQRDIHKDHIVNISGFYQL